MTFFSTPAIRKVGAAPAAALLCLFLGAPAQAFVPAGSGSPLGGPAPVPHAGPAVPYISGRFAAPQPAVTPPAGAVVPDDFCVPGKLNPCSGQTHGAGETAAGNAGDSAAPGTVFFGDPNKAFSASKNSFWIGGRSRSTDYTASSDNERITSFSFGGDRRIGENFILGAMIMRSNDRMHFAGPSIDDTGTGTLAGPYFAYHLPNNWALDGRVLAGNVSHSVNTAGAFSGQYNSVETFAALRFSGEVDRSNWRFHPSVEFTTTRRNDAAYIDGVSGPVAAKSSSNSFLTGTILAYYDGLSLAGGALTPYAGLEATKSLGSGNPYGTMRLGVTHAFDNGATLNIDYANGAMGLSNTTDRMISFRIEFPF